MGKKCKALQSCLKYIKQLHFMVSLSPKQRLLPQLNISQGHRLMLIRLKPIPRKWGNVSFAILLYTTNKILPALFESLHQHQSYRTEKQTGNKSDKLGAPTRSKVLLCVKSNHFSTPGSRGVNRIQIIRFIRLPYLIGYEYGLDFPIRLTISPLFVFVFA